MGYISRSEYLKKIQNNKGWLPGRDSITEAYRKIYRGCKVQYIRLEEIVENGVGLDGFCVAKSNAHELCITTCGLSQILPNEDAYGRMRSGWGIEFTVRCAEAKAENCNDAFKLLARLAQLVQTRKTVPSAYSTLSFSRVVSFPNFGSDSFMGLLILPDRELGTIQTIHGDVRFLQIVNLTKTELDILKKHPGMAQQLIFNMRKDNPDLVLDPSRNKNYLE